MNNLLEKAIKDLYMYGNTSLEIGSDNIIITFFIENNELKIKMKRYFEKNLSNIFYFSLEEGFTHIACLVFYSINLYKQVADRVQLSSTINEKTNNYNNITVINELFYQLKAMILCAKSSLKVSSLDTNNFTVFVNHLANNTIFEKNYKLLQINEILGNLSPSLYDLVGLNSLNIDHELLTSKNYITNPAIGRENEIEALETAILMPSKSTLLVGEPGSGKTAIVEGLAYKIINKQVPNILQDKKILKVNISSIIKGCTLVGALEEKVERLVKYLIQNPDTILFIDEFHTSIGAGKGKHDTLDLANMLKPYLDRGQIKIIGATTTEEYDEYIKNDKAYNRRFQKVNISEPNKDSLFQIVEETIKKLTKTTNLNWEFTTENQTMIINHIIETSNVKHCIYNDKRYNPDASITILELAFAISLQKGLNNVPIESIVKAIKQSDFIYESVRERSANKLLAKYQTSSPKQIQKCKVIKFPNY